MSIAMPRIGDPAPDFNQVSTHGPIQFSSWQGNHWVLLFSHPADFTPVCSTELTELARRSAEFDALQTKLIGLSIDSIHSHLAWRENLREKLGVEIPYPILADLDMKVAALYGMLHPGASSTATVRAVFFIDPTRTVRAMAYYPMSVGRNVDELLRILQALQTGDAHKCATPVNWRPGEKVIVPAPKTVEDVAERKSNAKYEKIDFYLNLKSI